MPTFALIGLVLLLAGTVEAGERSIEPPGMGFMVCDADLRNCTVNQPLMEQRAACYQRMQEAMRMMRLTVDAAYRGAIVTATPQPSPTPKEIWDATMKECVQ